MHNTYIHTYIHIYIYNALNSKERIKYSAKERSNILRECKEAQTETLCESNLVCEIISIGMNYKNTSILKGKAEQFLKE